VIAAGLTSWRVIGTSAPTAPVVYRPVPLTSYPGSQDDPSFSPDGTEIAFDWDGSNQDNFDIYVKLIGPGAPLRLTTDPAPDIDPRWSPDGRSIAFLRMTDDYTRFSVILIPALGGPERRLGTFANNASLASLPMESLCWTPDSKALVVSAAESAGKPNRLLLVPLDGEPKVLTHPNPDDTAFGDTRPSVSHDGRNLTFVRSAGGIYKALVVPVSSGMELRGEPHRLSIKEQVISHVDWLPGDREILVSAGGSGAEAQWLYRISTDQGAEERPVPGAGAASFSPAVSSRGNRLAYATGALDANFWSVDLATHASAMDRALSSSYRDVFPQFSPDGKRVVFYSNRSGSLQVWVANADGSQAGALTSMSGPVTGSPRWSPDGQQIAFDSNTGGAYHVYVIAGDGGQPRQVTRLRSFFANWSRDGRWIYFTSPASGDDQIWKAPATGGDPVQVTHGGGEGPVESVDGKALYFVRQNRGGGIWKMPVAGGDEDRVLKNEVYRVNYAVTDKGIYFTPRSARDGTSSVQFFSFASGKVIQIVKVAKLLDLGLGVSPDGRTLLYSQIDHTGSNLMLIESFH
jgi:Tol biopolymer transport system component